MRGGLRLRQGRAPVLGAAGGLVLILGVALGVGGRAISEHPLLVVAALGKGGVPRSTRDGLQQVLTHEVARSGRFEVISADELNAILQLEQTKDLLGCDDVACAARIGGALDARFVLAGSVSRLGDTALISLKLIDLEEQRVARRVCVEARYVPAALPYAMRDAVRRLLAEPAAAEGESGAAPLARVAEPPDAWALRLKQLLAVEIECHVLRDCIFLARAQIDALERFDRETDWSRRSRRERQLVERRLAELRRGLEALETTELKTGPAGPFEIGLGSHGP